MSAHILGCPRIYGGSGHRCDRDITVEATTQGASLVLESASLCGSLHHLNDDELDQLAMELDMDRPEAV